MWYQSVWLYSIRQVIPIFKYLNERKRIDLNCRINLFIVFYSNTSYVLIQFIISTRDTTSSKLYYLLHIMKNKKNHLKLIFYIVLIISACTFWCLSKFDFWAVAYEQSGHLNGFSLEIEWFIICALNVDFRPVANEQSGHLNGFSRMIHRMYF